MKARSRREGSAGTVRAILAALIAVTCGAGLWIWAAVDCFCDKDARQAHIPGLFRIRGGIRSASHGITAKHGISETSGTTVNVVEPI